jgi:hypothetical protein
MLTYIPDNNRAVTTCNVWDITEPKPIPRGSWVDIQDFDSCYEPDGCFIVEYKGRIYLALPGELR